MCFFGRPVDTCNVREVLIWSETFTAWSRELQPACARYGLGQELYGFSTFCGLVSPFVPLCLFTWRFVFPVLIFQNWFSSCFFCCLVVRGSWWRLFSWSSRVSHWICLSLHFYWIPVAISVRTMLPSWPWHLFLQEVHKFLDLRSWILIDTWTPTDWRKCCMSLCGLH